MSDDKEIHARADGRLAIAQATAWRLDLAGGITFRCVRHAGSHVVELREPSGTWHRMPGWTGDATGLLIRVVGLPSLRQLLEANA